MPAKRQVILDPFVSEYVYSCIVNSTIEQRKMLNGKFLYATRTSKKAKTFSVKSTDEEKRILLAKLGVQFAWVFYIEKDKLDELLGTTGKVTNSQIAKIMIDQKVMVVSNRQVMSLLGLMSSNCHSETWMMNRDYLTMGYLAKQWRKQYEHPTNKEIKDGLVESREIAKLMVNTIMASKSTEGMFGVTETEMSVLLYMMSRQKEFVPEHEMKVYFRGLYREFRINVALKQLVLAQYISKNLTDPKVSEYNITGWGVDVAMKFQKRVFNLLNF